MQYFKKVSQNCKINSPKENEVFPPETHNDVNFHSTYKALNFINLPLNPTMKNFSLFLAEIQ